MRKIFISTASALLAAVLLFSSCRQQVREYDVLIVGGGASGVAAGIQASRMGASTLIVEELPWLGGMLTSAGVTAFDGNFRMPAGIFGEFREHLVEHYGGLDSLHTGWVSRILFEPSAGNEIFGEMTAAEPNLTVEREAVASDIRQLSDGTWEASVRTKDGKKFNVRARVLIDGTELGDVAAAVGVGYDLGFENRAVTGEEIAPDTAVNIIQDLTMVATLKDYGHDVTMPRPDGYDPEEFAYTCVNDLNTDSTKILCKHSAPFMMEYGHLPHGKYMINWPFDGNDIYMNIVEMTREQRDSAIAVAKAKTLRYVYFIQDYLGFRNLGLADDEYPTADHLPMMPYHRESRRIHGKVRFTFTDIDDPYREGATLYRTNIAVGDYPVDHHHREYSGDVDIPLIYFHAVPSYGLPMGVLMPDSVENLLVTEKSISVSNIANGTTRLQPIVVQIGQAAGAIAAIAAKEGIPTSQVDVRAVQNVILEAGGYLMPFLDVAKSDPRFKAYQRVGATGILRGEGRSIAWSNETWLRADEPLLTGELADFAGFYSVQMPSGELSVPVDYATAEALISAAAGKNVSLGKEGTISRGEFALAVDSILNPFARPVTLTGKY